MKYFTAEHYLRGNSTNEDDLRGIEEVWERALRAYRRRWNRIRHAFPRIVQHFVAKNVCLHDAHVLSMTRTGKKLVMVLEREPPSHDLVILTFTLAGELEIDMAALPVRRESGIVAWLYEEWDLDQRGQCFFEVLLSNGWSVKLPFRDFRYSIGEQLLPTSNGRRRRRRASAAGSVG